MLKSENLQTSRKWEGNLMLLLEPWPPGRRGVQGKKVGSGKALNNVLNPRNVLVGVFKNS